MEAAEIPINSHSVKEYTFIAETFPPPQQDQPQQQHGPQLDPQRQIAQIAASLTEPRRQLSEFSQDFYTEGMIRRVQPPRARRTDFGKHTADELIIDAIERAEKEKPVIPPDTVFFCTTDSSVMQNMEVVLASIHPAGTGSADELPMHSYFRDPEVMRKIRSQEIIETPSWREATKEDWEGALLEIPEPWRGIPPDTSLEYYRRHHIKLERLEATIRNREKAKLAHDYHHLKARLAELQQLDASGFRGETPAEQEKDKILVLAAAKRLLENQRVKGKVEDKDVEEGIEDGTKGTSGDDGVSSSKANTTRPSKKKKESKWEYYPIDFDLDGELIGDSSKKKKAKKKATAAVAAATTTVAVVARPDKSSSGASKKRKRDDMEMEYVLGDEEPEEEDEYVEGGSTVAYLKKAKAVPAPRRSLPIPKGPGFAVREKEKDEKASKLLDLARKYNPRRPPRDVYPFGALLPELEVIDFDLPDWLGWSFDDQEDDVDALAERPADPQTEDHPEETDAMNVSGGEEVVHKEQEPPTTVEEESAPTSGDGQTSDQEDSSPRPFVLETRKMGSVFVALDDAESSVLSELTDEETHMNQEATNSEQQQEEPVEEEEEELEEEYAILKSKRSRKSSGRSYSSKSKKARRR